MMKIIDFLLATVIVASIISVGLGASVIATPWLIAKSGIGRFFISIPKNRFAVLVAGDNPVGFTENCDGKDSKNLNWWGRVLLEKMGICFLGLNPFKRQLSYPLERLVYDHQTRIDEYSKKYDVEQGNAIKVGDWFFMPVKTTTNVVFKRQDIGVVATDLETVGKPGGKGAGQLSIAMAVTVEVLDPIETLYKTPVSEPGLWQNYARSKIVATLRSYISTLDVESVLALSGGGGLEDFISEIKKVNSDTGAGPALTALGHKVTGVRILDVVPIKEIADARLAQQKALYEQVAAEEEAKTAEIRGRGAGAQIKETELGRAKGLEAVLETVASYQGGLEYLTTETRTRNIGKSGILAYSEAGSAGGETIVQLPSTGRSQEPPSGSLSPERTTKARKKSG